MLKHRALMAASGGALDLSNMPDAVLVYHFKAEDYVAPDWPDRTPNGYDLGNPDQPSRIPVYVADGGADFNNKPVVRLTNDRLFRSGTPSVPQPSTRIAIFKLTGGNATNKYLLSSFSGSSQRCDIYFDSAERVGLVGGSVGILDGNVNFDTPLLIEGFVNGVSSDLKINGATAATGNCGTETAVGITIGNWGNGSLWVPAGDLAEIVCVSGQLTQADRTYLLNYVNEEYGFNLPLVETFAFTAVGSTVHTVPAGKTSARIQAWGAGGAGGGADSDGDWTGGGSGAYAECDLAVTPGQELTVQIGAGGTSGPNEGGQATGVHNGSGFSVDANIHVLAGAGGAAGGANSLITSGRGGYGGGGGRGGGGGESSGGQGGGAGTSSVGAGGSGSDSNGAAGSGNTGGAPTAPSANGGGGGGGGDGWKGGGAGGVDTQQSGGGGGGGASSYINPAATNANTVLGNNGGANARGAAIEPAGRPSASTGQGGAESGAGAAGAVVITYDL